MLRLQSRHPRNHFGESYLESLYQVVPKNFRRIVKALSKGGKRIFHDVMKCVGQLVSSEKGVLYIWSDYVGKLLNVGARLTSEQALSSGSTGSALITTEEV